MPKLWYRRILRNTAFENQYRLSFFDSAPSQESLRNPYNIHDIFAIPYYQNHFYDNVLKVAPFGI
jgi:hypothetical protein